jgi:uncharacterized membrane protein
VAAAASAVAAAAAEAEPVDMAGGSRSCLNTILSTALLILGIGLFFVFVGNIVTPAKSYTTGPVTIEAQISPDGTLTVHEQRTFVFKGSFSAVWWDFNTKGTDGYTITGMSLTRRDGTTTKLEEVPFDTVWRFSGGPGYPAFSVDKYGFADIDGEKVDPYVFFEAKNETLVITLDYTVANNVETYSDTAEFYWQIVNDSWSVDSSKVSLTLTLPAPANYTKEAGNVHAWGRGALNGNTEIREDGSLVFYVPRVAAGSYAEAQVLFPVEWMSDMPVEHSAEHLQMRLDEMALWEAEANQKRFETGLVIALSIVVSLGALAIAFIVFLVKGRGYKPRFKDKYLREIPSDDHPAVLGAIWNWGEIGARELDATIMRLADQGVIHLEKSVRSGEVVGAESAEDYSLAVDETKRAALKNPIDRAALKLVFDTVGAGEEPLFFSTISQNAYANPDDFGRAFDDWRGTVESEVERRRFFDRESPLKKVYFWIGGAMTVIHAILALLLSFTANPGPFIPPVIVGILVILLGSRVKRISPEAAELRARSAALRNWLKDFSNLDEAIPTDVKVWDHFLVYATLFGVADKVNKQLAEKLPQVCQSPSFRLSSTWVAPLSDDAPVRSPSRTFDSLAGRSKPERNFSGFDRGGSGHGVDWGSRDGGDWSRSGGGGGGFVGGGGKGSGGGGGSRGSGAR